ncbi:hypothetical protein [uncultured Clostridium sp.]|uniref:hypothetical protein n=1 Tax=uncultured Clostridium sp. TaxID=59620 RepID=UPI0025D35A9D|nr:hypothetical protein [uncultured Clostridium sp.]
MSGGGNVEKFKNETGHSLAGGNLRGVLYCLIAAVCYALYAALNKKQTYPKELSRFTVFAGVILK